MPVRLPAACVALTAVTVLAIPTASAQESEADRAARLALRLLNHYSILFARSAVDLTYESLSITPETFDTVLTGVRVYPDLGGEDPRACEVVIDRLSSGTLYSFETSETLIEINGLTVPRGCMAPEQAAMILGMGYDGLTSDTMSIRISYDLPSSAAEISVVADVVEAVDLSIDASFDYLWLRLPLDGGNDEPVPVARLGAIEASLENRGLWERMEPILSAQLGDLSTAPQMVEGMVLQGLSGPTGAAPGAEAQAFAADLGREIGRFLEEKNRLVVAARPQNGLWLDETLLADPNALLASLNPSVSAVPSPIGALIPPADLAAALGGGALDDEARRRVGRALVTGIGAPRSIEEGAEVLDPLVAAWDGEAVALLAEARAAQGATEDAYRLALRAMSASRAEGITLADQLETELALDQTLVLQRQAYQTWPGAEARDTEDTALLDSADVPAIRQRAYDAALGDGVPRNYAQAYLWATLAAAAGDRGAATLRDRLDRRFSGSTGGAWTDLTRTAGREAAEIWSQQGLATRILGRFGLD